MKKLLYLLTLVFALAGCQKDEPKPETKGKLDPNAMITIRGVNNPAKAAVLRAYVYQLTPLEVVQNAIAIKFQTHYADNAYSESAWSATRAFIEQHKDYEKPALLMRGADIINSDGVFVKDFINAFNVYITGTNNDTIARLPDEVINNARPLIEAAFNDGNYTEVYRLFNEAFTFTPIPFIPPQ